MYAITGVNFEDLRENLLIMVSERLSTFHGSHLRTSLRIISLLSKDIQRWHQSLTVQDFLLYIHSTLTVHACIPSP